MEKTTEINEDNFTIRSPRTPASSIASLTAASWTVSSFSQPPYKRQEQIHEKTLWILITSTPSKWWWGKHIIEIDKPHKLEISK
jgi:hypothetical protein